MGLIETLPADLRSPDVVEMFRAVGRGHLPSKAKRLVSEWADQERMLVSETSAEAGFWRTSRAPMQREPMDALSLIHI